jgi:recombination protein RecA
MAIPLELLSSSVRLASALGDRSHAPSRSCDWPELDRALPDGGMPHAVVEITCAHRAFAGATRVAAASVRAAHVRDARAWCAWIDSNATLYAPGLARAGVDLARLLVMRPPRELAARVMVKAATSGAFDVMIVELHDTRVSWKVMDKLVRKLAIAAETHGTSILLLASPHRDPWPVALRLEIARVEDGIDVRVTKDRFGRALAKTRVPISLSMLGTSRAS